MAIHQSIPRLVCYDIADPKRLGRVHRIALDYGVQVQYSVYLVEADAPTLDALCADLRRVIDPREDDIRIYPLSTDRPADTLGRDPLGPGIQLPGGPLTAIFGDAAESGDDRQPPENGDKSRRSSKIPQGYRQDAESSGESRSGG